MSNVAGYEELCKIVHRVGVPSREEVDNRGKASDFALGFLAHFAEVKRIKKEIFCYLCIAKTSAFCGLRLTSCKKVGCRVDVCSNNADYITKKVYI